MKLDQELWTVKDAADLRAAVECGHSVGEIAEYMHRDQQEVLAKMHALGLVPMDMTAFRQQ